MLEGERRENTGAICYWIPIKDVPPTQTDPPHTHFLCSLDLKLIFTAKFWLGKVHTSGWHILLPPAKTDWVWISHLPPSAIIFFNCNISCWESSTQFAGSALMSLYTPRMWKLIFPWQRYLDSLIWCYVGTFRQSPHIPGGTDILVCHRRKKRVLWFLNA